MLQEDQVWLSVPTHTCCHGYSTDSVSTSLSSVNEVPLSQEKTLRKAWLKEELPIWGLEKSEILVSQRVHCPIGYLIAQHSLCRGDIVGSAAQGGTTSLWMSEEEDSLPCWARMGQTVSFPALSQTQHHSRTHPASAQVRGPRHKTSKPAICLPSRSSFFFLRFIIFISFDIWVFAYMYVCVPYGCLRRPEEVIGLPQSGLSVSCHVEETRVLCKNSKCS